MIELKVFFFQRSAHFSIVFITGIVTKDCEKILTIVCPLPPTSSFPFLFTPLVRNCYKLAVRLEISQRLIAAYVSMAVKWLQQSKFLGNVYSSLTQQPVFWASAS